MTNSGNADRPTSEELLAELRRALNASPSSDDAPFARLDVHRARRTGSPEIILAENKAPEQVIELVDRMVTANGSVLVSRVPATTLPVLGAAFGDFLIEESRGAEMLRISSPGYRRPDLLGNVAIFTAGTSDLQRADEVRMVVEEMGVSGRVWADLGVAGLHRLIQPFQEAIVWGSDVIVVAAGMDGALPSVVAGLSPIPVIGLPTSTGYGYGGNGEGALMAMLQSCAPGLTVVNIDNSVGAGISAARIARQSAT